MAIRPSRPRRSISDWRPDVDTESVLIGIPDIADIADVSAQAVSNWRKRYKDFPEPRVHSDSGVLFDLRAVEEWLLSNSKIDRPVQPGALVWRVADALRANLRDTLFDSTGSMLFDVTSSWLCYLEACGRAERRATLFARDDGSEPAVEVAPEHRWSDVRRSIDSALPRRLRAAAKAIEDDNPSLTGLFEALAPDPFPPAELLRRFVYELEGATDQQPRRRSELFEEAQRNMVEVSRSTGEYTSPDNLSALIASLVGSSGSTIVDPACGTGGLLLRAALTRGSNAPHLQIVGADRNTAATRNARARFFLHGLDADILSLDSLRREPAEWPVADLVVCDPPYGMRWGDAELYRSNRWRYGSPPASSADLAWVQIAISMLKPSGTAAVVLPPSASGSGGIEAEIRGRLVRAGLIEAVILLPARLRRNTSIPLTIWLLRGAPSDDGEQRVLLIDASSLGTASRSTHDLDDSDIGHLATVVQQWRLDRRLAPTDTVAAIAVDLERLEASMFNLSLRRHQPERAAADVHELGAEATTALNSTRQAVDLVRQAIDAVRLDEPASFNGPRNGPTRLGLVADVIRPRAMKEDEDGMAAHEGDVLLTMTPDGYKTVLLSAGEAIRGVHAIIIRPREGAAIEPAWLLAWTQSDDFADLVHRYAKGTLVKTLPVKELAEATLMIPSVSAQESCRELVHGLAQLAAAGQQLDGAVAALRSAAVRLRYGAFAR